MMRYMKPLLEHIEKGEINPDFVVGHRVPIDKAPGGVSDVQGQARAIHKVIIDPWTEAAAA